MEGPAKELREKVIGKELVEVRTSGDGWMTLVFSDGTGPEWYLEWSIRLDAARPIDSEENHGSH